jgi:hypothetical protein
VQLAEGTSGKWDEIGEGQAPEIATEKVVLGGWYAHNVPNKSNRQADHHSLPHRCFLLSLSWPRRSARASRPWIGKAAYCACNSQRGRVSGLSRGQAVCGGRCVRSGAGTNDERGSAARAGRDARRRLPVSSPHLFLMKPSSLTGCMGGVFFFFLLKQWTGRASRWASSASTGARTNNKKQRPPPRNPRANSSLPLRVARTFARICSAFFSRQIGLPFSLNWKRSRKPFSAPKRVEAGSAGEHLHTRGRPWGHVKPTRSFV